MHDYAVPTDDKVINLPDSRWGLAHRVTGNLPPVFRVTGNRSNRQRVSELNDGSATSKQDYRRQADE